MDYTTQVSIKETNDNGYGFECSVQVDPSLDDLVSFDISWLHVNNDGNTEYLDTVGVLMTPEAAMFISVQLQDCAWRAKKNKSGNEDEEAL